MKVGCFRSPMRMYGRDKHLYARSDSEQTRAIAEKALSSLPSVEMTAVWFAAEAAPVVHDGSEFNNRQKTTLAL